MVRGMRSTLYLSSHSAYIRPSGWDVDTSSKRIREYLSLQLSLGAVKLVSMLQTIGATQLTCSLSLQKAQENGEGP